MLTIFQLEIRKAVVGRKNLFVLVLYSAFLLAFILINAAAFSEVREREGRHFETMAAAVDTRANHYRARSIYDLQRPAHISDDVVEQRTILYRLLRRLGDYAQQMVVAMQEAGRMDEIAVISAINYAFVTYYEWRLAYFPYSTNQEGFPPAGLGGTLFLFPERVPFHRAYYDFSKYLLDNDIYMLYESEMLGINFAFQVMRHILPLAILFIVFTVVSDVFTADNQWGSYKFLLVNPISRTKVYIAKMAAAVTVALAIIFGPILFLALALGVINGFGFAGYPILVQSGAYTSFTPLPNNLWYDRMRGNFVGYIWRPFFQLGNYYVNTGLAYVPEQRAIGLTVFSSHIPYGNFFTPHPDLVLLPMLTVILMTLPLYLLLVLAAVAASAMLGVIFQRSIPTLIMGVALGMGVVLFPAPDRGISISARLNPLIYTNPVNILNGLGSTTALTGIAVLALWCALFTVAGLMIFARRDIRC
jgi:ABC-type transport system involved in multi-copper enzyme maturation permease subunit